MNMCHARVKVELQSMEKKMEKGNKQLLRTPSEERYTKQSRGRMHKDRRETLVVGRGEWRRFCHRTTYLGNEKKRRQKMMMLVMMLCTKGFQVQFI